MRLRLDLLEYLTDEDVLEEAIAQLPRYSAEPVFARTGSGFLRPASPEEVAAEEQRMKALQRRLEERKSNGGRTKP